LSTLFSLLGGHGRAGELSIAGALEEARTGALADVEDEIEEVRAAFNEAIATCGVRSR